MARPTDGYGQAEYDRASTTNYWHVAGGAWTDAKGGTVATVPAGGVAFTGPRLFNNGPPASAQLDGASGRLELGDVLDPTGTAPFAYVIVARMDAATSAAFTRLLDKSYYTSDTARGGHFVAVSNAGLTAERVANGSDAVSTGIPVVGQPFHLYVGYGDGTLELAFNGGTLIAAPSSLAIPDVAQPFVFGATAGGGNYFGGCLAAVTRGNARLSRAELDASYAAYLAQPNPAPTLAAVSPATVGRGAGDTTITLTGTNFAAGVVARLDGAALATVGTPTATSLTATIPAAALAATGSPTLTVANPDGQGSGARRLAVVPVVTFLIKAGPGGLVGARTLTVDLPPGLAYAGAVDLAGWAIAAQDATALTLTTDVPLNPGGLEQIRLLFAPQVGVGASVTLAARVATAGDADPTNDAASLTVPVAVPVAAVGRVWYVHPTAGSDANDGARGTPFATVAAGLAKLTTAGDTLSLRGGSYPDVAGNRALTFARSGVAGNPIVIAAYPGETPQFTGTRVASRPWLTLTGSYVTVKGLRLQQFGQNFLQNDAALLVAGGTGAEVRDLDARDNGYAGVRVQAPASGCTIAGGNYEGNVVGINIDTAPGCTIGGPTLADGVYSHDNTKMCRNGGDSGQISPDTGIVEPKGEHGGQGCSVLYVSTGTTLIQNNTFVNNHASSVTYTWDGSAIEQYLSPGTKIRGNFGLNNVNFCEHAGDASGVELTRNICINGALFVAHQSNGVLIAHNTVAIWTGGLPVWQQAYYPFWFGPGGGTFGNGDTTGGRIVNNILDSPNQLLGVFSKGWLGTLDNNLYRTGGTFIQSNGVSYATLAAWQAASGKDRASLIGIPGFVNPTGTTRGDYALAATTSPAVDLGQRLPGLNDGYLGAAPDAGATERG